LFCALFHFITAFSALRGFAFCLPPDSEPPADSVFRFRFFVFRFGRSSKLFGATGRRPGDVPQVPRQGRERLLGPGHDEPPIGILDHGALSGVWIDRLAMGFPYGGPRPGTQAPSRRSTSKGRAGPGGAGCRTPEALAAEPWARGARRREPEQGPKQGPKQEPKQRYRDDTCS
jgi:hypothetical protein